MKKKLVFIIAGVVVVVGLIVGAVFLFKPATVARDDEGYNAAISEVCAFYRVQIADYDEKSHLYMLRIDPSTWDAHDDIARTQFCRNCRDAFVRMMRKYGIISGSESVDLKVYKNGSLVASVINGSIDIVEEPESESGSSFGLLDGADAFVEEFTEAYDKIYDGIMDSYKEKEKELLKEFGY